MPRNPPHREAGADSATPGPSSKKRRARQALDAIEIQRLINQEENSDQEDQLDFELSDDEEAEAITTSTGIEEIDVSSAAAREEP